MTVATAPVAGHILRDANFRRWYLARSISYGGTAATAVALPLLAYQTTGSAALTGAVAALEALPYLFFGLIAGAMADRLSRRRLMIGAEILAAVAVLSAPAAHLAGVLTSAHVLIVAFTLGAAFCWFDAAAWGALTRVAGRSRLTEANSLIWATATVAGIAMPAAAGLAATAFAPSAVLAADALTYLVSIVFLRRITVPLDGDGPGQTGGSMRADIVAGLRYLWREPVIRTLSVAGFGLSTAAGGVFGLLVVHADQRLDAGAGAGDHRIGLLYSAAAVGALLSAVLLPIMTRVVGVGPLSIGAYLCCVVGVVALAGATSFAIAIALWLGWEFAGATARTNGITVRQQLTPDHLQGRVNTTGRMIAWGGTPFGALLGGLLADTYDVGTAYLCMTIPLGMAVLVLLASPVPRLRTIPSPA